MSDTLRCPHCDADLYSTEEICWRCQARVEPSPTRASSAPPQPGQPDDDTRRLAHWSFGFGVAGLVCACPFVGPLALWLGIRARRAGAGGLALAGVTLGIIETGVAIAVAMIGLAWAWNLLLDRVTG